MQAHNAYMCHCQYVGYKVQAWYMIYGIQSTGTIYSMQDHDLNPQIPGCLSISSVKDVIRFKWKLRPKSRAGCDGIWGVGFCWSTQDLRIPFAITKPFRYLIFKQFWQCNDVETTANDSLLVRVEAMPRWSVHAVMKAGKNQQSSCLLCTGSILWDILTSSGIWTSQQKWMVHGNFCLKWFDPSTLVLLDVSTLEINLSKAMWKAQMPRQSQLFVVGLVMCGAKIGEKQLMIATLLSMRKGFAQFLWVFPDAEQTCAIELVS